MGREAVLSLRQRTGTALLVAVGPLAAGPWSDFHRVLCLRVWFNWPLGRVLAALVLELIPPDQPVVCPVADPGSKDANFRPRAARRARPGGGVSPSHGTAERPDGWNWSGAKGTGSKAAKAWYPSAGCLSTT